MLTQEEIKELLLPILREKGILYAKFLPIRARTATSGETIQTITSDGLETENTAEEGDYIIQNQTQAKELYLVNSKKFDAKYEFLESLEDGWSRFKPTGKAWGIEVSPELVAQLNWTMPFKFMASWGSTMIVKEGDFLVCPPDYRSVYRIARQEFFETYKEDQP